MYLYWCCVCKKNHLLGTPYRKDMLSARHCGDGNRQSLSSIKKRPRTCAQHGIYDVLSIQKTQNNGNYDKYSYAFACFMS